MLFDSFAYIFLFLPLLIFLLYFTNNSKLNLYILIISSIFFYAMWNFNSLKILIISIIFNFFFGEFLSKFKKKTLLFFSISFNLFILGYFKYYNFFIQNINLLVNENFNYLNIVYPLAISFYTFQQITYLVDVFNDEIKDRNIVSYFLFVSFFPQLVAGPIVKYNYLVPQFKNLKIARSLFKNFPVSFLLISIGLFKKIFLADYFGNIVDAGYRNIYYLDTLESWIVTFSFTLQFYFDFSAYIDLALGSSMLFGIKLPINFNSPYKSVNLIDFWSRWHITLSNFLYQYIYYPLVRLKGNFSFIYSLFITCLVFLIAGIWHGPSWFFLIFGAMHGIGVVFKQINKNYIFFKIGNKISIFFTLMYVNLSLIFFRSSNLDEIKALISKMIIPNFSLPVSLQRETAYSIISFDGFLINICENSLDKIYIIFYFLISFYIVYFFKNSNQIANNFNANYKGAIFSLIIFFISLIFKTNNNAFIYFNF